MKRYILFNFFVQILILFTSVELFFDNFGIKFLLSLLIIGIIFIPSFFEFSFSQVIKEDFHYIITIICLLLFMFLIAF